MTALTDDVRPRPRVLAFEMQSGGHHPSYIRNFAQQWADRIFDHDLDFVVTRDFFQRHRQVVEQVQVLKPESIRIHEMSAEDSHRVRYDSKLREFVGWRIFCGYAERLQAAKALLMYSDHFQLPMLFGRSAPCPVSCIYFRPTFHYRHFEDYRPTLAQRIAATRKRIMLARLLKIRQLDTLFCLDPVAVDYIASHFRTQASIRQLPDSFVRNETPPGRIEGLRSELGIEPGRRVLLLLGILDSRKGPLQLLDAVARISAAAQESICLLMVGQIDEAIQAEVLARAADLQRNSRAQVVMHNEYISDSVVQQYYELADVALTTYQRHMGMSSALIRAALAGIPVLSSSYGLMGELVRRHRLGIVMDTTAATAFASAIEQVTVADPQSLFDAREAATFAESHSPQSLGNTLQQWVASN